MTAARVAGLRRELARAVALAWLDDVLASLLIRDAEQRLMEIDQ